ncbi:putative leucine-rich repeat domain superfamily [Tanacetum coccineum]
MTSALHYSSSRTKCLPTNRYPLAYPKVASWKINSSKGGTDCCLWDGVECSNKTSGHVIGLDLSSSFLYGTINSTSSLFDLIHLRRLNLADNNFNFSQISSEIGRFSRMKRLDLSGSSFAGTLPASVSNLTQLEFLNLHDNSLWGRIPNLASLSKLRYLSLFSNDFDGRNISDWIGKLPKLSVLDLRLNNLSCEIPSSIGNLTQLEYLYLNYNNMFGQIPSSLMNLTNLIDIILAFNDLTGSIPNLESLSNLEDLFLSVNKFEKWTLPDWLGPIPPFPSSLTKLTTLALMENQLRGPIPRSLSNLKNVEAVVLHDNKISDTVEVDMFLALKKLTLLTLGGNQITLSVINNHTNNTPPKIEILNLGSCNLRAFPHFLRFQDQLQELYLDDNNISGLIPEWMGNVSKQTLQTLLLSKNSLTGFEKNWPVVTWLLDLSFNNISGSIPLCFDKLYNSLLVLNLRGNVLQGNIPNTFTNGSKLLMINLSENQLEGQLLRSLVNCASLQILDLGSNHIDDMYPFWLGALHELQVVILRSNKLHCTIRIAGTSNPSFPKVRIIDLSYNSFSGDFPHEYFHEWLAMKETKSDATYMQANIAFFVANYFWLGNYSYSMKMVNKGVSREYEKILNIFIAVDFSSNKFRGIIPDSIKELSGLQLLNLSNNEFSVGRPQGDELPKQKRGRHKFSKGTQRVIITLPDEAIGRLKTFEERLKSKKEIRVDSQESLMFTRHEGQGKPFRERGRGRFNQSRCQENNRSERKNWESSQNNFKKDSNKFTHDKSKVLCFKCKEYGHFANKCPSNKEEQSNLIEEAPGRVGSENLDGGVTESMSRPEIKEDIYAARTPIGRQSVGVGSENLDGGVTESMSRPEIKEDIYAARTPIGRQSVGSITNQKHDQSGFMIDHNNEGGSNQKNMINLDLRKITAVKVEKMDQEDLKTYDKAIVIKEENVGLIPNCWKDPVVRGQHFLPSFHLAWEA